MYMGVYASPLGSLTLVEEGGRLTALRFGGAPTETEKSPLLREAERQLTEYFAGTRREFRLPLAPEGTPFQKRVWAALLDIPYGQTRSYGEIARAVGSPRGARAVGMANNRNPFPILIPCHRCIGAKGDLVGYAGGLEIKIFLLSLERRGRPADSCTV